jgi:5-methylcytosine-specific restriction endonuclease McrA
MSDTLVLNRNFAAVHISSWQKAVSLLYQGHAQAVDENLVAYDFSDWVELSKQMKDNPKGFVHSSTLRVAVPEVIRLTRYDKLPRQDAKFTRHNIYQHYKFKCCYCGDKLSSKELNLDHVMPRALGGPTNWDNIVLSCLPCNAIKADRPIGDVFYPSAAELRRRGFDRLMRLAGQKMHLLVKPGKPKWHGIGTIVVQSPVPIPVSWQQLIDRKYWESELED